MRHIFNENAYNAVIFLDNGTPIISSEDKQSIEYVLSKVNIGFGCIELHSGPQASLFRGIAVFINENLTSLIVGSLLMPVAYDAIKLAFKKIVSSIKNGSVRIVTTNKIYMPTLILKFVTKKGLIEAPIPDDLSDVQFEKYIDLLNVAIQSLTDDIISQGELIAEFEPESGSIHIKTVLEYGREQCEEQQTQK